MNESDKFFDIQINILLNLQRMIINNNEGTFRLSDSMGIDYIVFNRMLQGGLKDRKYRYLWYKIIKVWGEGITKPHWGMRREDE